MDEPGEGSGWSRGYRPGGIDGINPGSLWVLLIGNYPMDRQESMQRFALMMMDGLEKRGVSVGLLCPMVTLGKLGASTVTGFGKWLGYIDKYLLFPRRLRRHIDALKKDALTGAADGGPAQLVIHICDHSNAMYSSSTRSVPCVVTCHDLLAVRGAMGEDTDCPASWAGKLLQRWIVKGLSRAAMVASVSTATMQDVERIVKLPAEGGRSCRVLSGLNYDFKILPPGVAEERLKAAPIAGRPFVLHVGSNLRRKNREGILRTFAKVANRWDGVLVFAGQGLSPELRAMADSLKIGARVLDMPKPDGAVLEALYNRAMALLFPSRFEGFGWPIIEAQACGCPVICSDSGPLPEVAGDAGLVFPVGDEDGFASAILRLADPVERAGWVRKGAENIKRFRTERMIDDYVRIYHKVSGRK